MKRIIFVLVTLLAFTPCSSSADINDDLIKLTDIPIRDESNIEQIKDVINKGRARSILMRWYR